MTSYESSLHILPDTFGLLEPQQYIDSEPLCNTLKNPKYWSEDTIEKDTQPACLEHRRLVSNLMGQMGTWRK